MSQDVETVHLTRDGAVATVTLDYPSRRNALGLGLREILHDRMAEAMADDAIRVIVLTGANGCFCAGGDISGMTDLTGWAGRARVARLHRLITLMLKGEKPIVAAVEGYAVGAGLSLAALCDIVVADETAKFNCAFNKVGLMPDMASTWVLPQRLGLGMARRLMMTGETIDAARAAQIGLVEEVVGKGAALDKAMEMARDLAAGAPAALAMTKAMLGRWPLSLEESLAAEADAQAILFTTDDFKEGVSAFLEKRKPTFRGR